MNTKDCVKLYKKYKIWANDKNDLQTKYKKFAVKHHPDKNPNSSVPFADINSCRDSLLEYISTPDSVKAYNILQELSGMSTISVDQFIKAHVLKDKYLANDKKAKQLLAIITLNFLK